jgi:hypothetical protein
MAGSDGVHAVRIVYRSSGKVTYLLTVRASELYAEARVHCWIAPMRVG